ncbi:GGDEF domain-containing protein [Geosporobacter ferrireducens]|uniref:GGDEF domain-containing protein n=1 Tax=Geosporobacter ferrireducens TaxID=1424294 RepID=A0A1D8GP01_9FIRM|nr:GGDEF domain-containing protein [Geosporobacter ferrireducens]AOT72622.1 hypothetical protein Gferi_25545 [Geosporobacter ferrireducens]MTI55024.1 GGDEF domain-containing protein [Geosporobacter ferrireducens]
MIEGFKEMKRENKNTSSLYQLFIVFCYSIAIIIFIFLNIRDWDFFFKDDERRRTVFLFIGYIILLVLSGALIFKINQIKKKIIELELEKIFLLEENQEYKKHIDQQKIYGTIDGMTGIYNRSFGLSFLDQQIKIAKRDRTDLTVSYLDINDLKIVNDTYGHSAGDALIIAACSILKENLRESDILCRMGGDEFLMILPGCSLEQADLVRKRVIDHLNEFNQKSILPYKLSISIGMAAYSCDADMILEQLINQADANMYYNKRHEKQNKLAIAEEN